MKYYLSLFLALGLFFAFSGRSEAAINCAKCKAAIPASTMPTVEMTKADVKCSICGANTPANAAVSKVTCPACKTELALCAMCAKSHADAMAANAMGQAQEAMKQGQQAWGQAQQSMDEAAKKAAGQ
jgi:hypothetical protein